MKKFRLFAIVFIAVLVVLTSCSGDSIGDQIGNIGDQIDNQLGQDSELKEVLISSVDEVLTKEGFKKCVNNLRDYDFDQVKDWDAEIGSVVDLLGVLHSTTSGEIVISDFTAQYRNIRTNTVFVNYVLISCASGIIPKLPYIDQYYDESVKINDWEKELDAVVDSLEVLLENDIKSADDLLAEDSKLDGEMMMIFEQSELIKSFIVKEINAMVEETGVAHINITQVDLENVDTAEKWDLELDALHDLIYLSEHSEDLELNEVVDIYEEVKVTILCKKILLDVTPEIIDTLPIVSEYYDEETKNEITDWEAELDAIVDSIDKLDAAEIESLDDLLNDDSKLTGEMMFAFSKSIILKKALLVELNKALENAGLEKDLITKEDIDAIDTVEKWDTELVALRDLVKLNDSSNELTFSEIVEIYDDVKATSLCYEILLESAPTLAESLPVVKDYYDDSVVIDDWGKELDAIVASVDALDKANLENFNDLLAEDSPLDGEMMLTFTQSIILKNAVVEEINKALANSGLEPNLITVADVESLDTEAKWDVELSAMRNLITLKDDAATLEFSQIVTIYDEVRATTLCNKVLIASAPTMAETLPVVKDYYDDSVVIDDWGKELDAIVASVDALDKANLEDFSDLLSSDSPLDGEMMLTFSQSIILKNAVVEEINKALENSGLESGLITIADIDTLDTEAKWDAELSAMRNLITLKDDAATLEFNEIVDIYEEVRATTLCNKVLIASAPTMAKTLPVVKDYYDDSVVIDDWGKELDAIVDTLDALSAANATNISNPLAEDSPLNGKVLNAATKSTILTKAIVDEMNTAVMNAGLAENIITVDNVQAVDTEEKWNAELGCMRRLVAINFASTNMTAVIDIYDDIKANTILCNSILVSSAAIIIPDLPIISNYYDENTMVIDDWGQELDAIVNAYKLLVNKGVDAITDPIETLDGQIIMACLDSVILRSAFITEFNKNLYNLGLSSYYTMDEAKLAELDTAEKWDNELTAIKAVSELVTNFNIFDPELSTKVNNVKNQVENTVIASAILLSFLGSMGM